MRKFILAWIVGVALCCAQEPDAVLVGMIREAATSEHPALSFLESLGNHSGDLSLGKQDVWLALDELGNLDLSPGFSQLVSRLEGIEVAGATSKQVRVKLSEPLGLDLGAGYAHLKREVAFELKRDSANSTLRLDRFQGFKLSKSKTAWIKVDLKSVTFDRELARVDAGIGGVHEIRLAPEAPAAPQVFAGEHPALTELVSKALTSQGSPLGVFLAGLPQLASRPDEPLILERDAIEASVSQALADTGIEASREVGQRTFRELLDELGTLTA